MQYQSSDTVQQFTRHRIIDLLHYAANNVPYYTEILQDVGVVKDGKVDLDRYGDIPPLTKATIRREGTRLHSRHCQQRGCYVNRSGGSSGEPVAFLQDAAYEDWSYAGRFFCNRLLGKDIGDVELSLWGSERDLIEGSIGVHKKIKHWLFNLTRLNSFLMDESRMRAHLTTMGKRRPVMLAGYMDSLFELARYVQKTKIEPFRPRFVLSQAGTLADAARAVIGDAFGAPVYDFYGSREMSPIACECLNHGYHILSTGQFVEVINVNHGWGDLLITCLVNYSMPFIRYQIGDKGALREDKCPCGRGLPMLRGVAGRAMECFRTREGRIIPPQYFVNIVRTVCGDGTIDKLQFVQTTYDRVIVRVVGRRQGEQLRNVIRERVKIVMGADCDVDFECVNDIAPSASGKYLYTISAISERSAGPNQASGL